MTQYDRVRGQLTNVIMEQLMSQDHIPKLLRSIIGNNELVVTYYTLRRDLVIIGNNEPIITVIICNNGTVIMRYNDVITEVRICNNGSNIR